MSTPVSYTHLDVYKRQVVTQAIYDLLINGKSAEEVCETMVEQQAWYFNS